jgi:hypothetical protein
VLVHPVIKIIAAANVIIILFILKYYMLYSQAVQLYITMASLLCHLTFVVDRQLQVAVEQLAVEQLAVVLYMLVAELQLADAALRHMP